MQKGYDDFKIIDENKFEELSLAYAQKLARVKVSGVDENVDQKLEKMLEILGFCLHSLENLIRSAKNKENLEIFLFAKNQVEEFFHKLCILYDKDENKFENEQNFDVQKNCENCGKGRSENENAKFSYAFPQNLPKSLGRNIKTKNKPQGLAVKTKTAFENEFSSFQQAFVDGMLSFLQNLFEFLGFETNVKIKISLENMINQSLNLLKKINAIKILPLKVFSLFRKRK